MNLSEKLFKQSALGLLKQGERCFVAVYSVDGNGCLFYDGEKMCAIGHLMDQPENAVNFKPWYGQPPEVLSSEKIDALYVVAPDMTGEGSYLGSQLTFAHDRIDPEIWRQELIALGQRFKFDTSFLEENQP